MTDASALNRDRTGDPLFANRRHLSDGRRSVVVVGLPRSGSSTLSQMMSDLPEWYVFDDLYLSRAARQAGVDRGPITPDALEKLLHFLGWQIRARKRHGMFAIPNVEEEEIPAMTDAMRIAFQETSAHWTDLQEDWLIRLATRAGARHWGYKQPGAFRDLDRLMARYPDMKAIFLMRAPEEVLASYKYMPEDSQDGDPRQYHPITHAIYWRMAARAYQRARDRYKEDRVMLLRFDQMIGEPLSTIQRLGAFLNTPFPDQAVLPEQSNSSFTGRTRRSLTGLEWVLLRSITWRERNALGFPLEGQAPPLAVSDLRDFFRVSLRAMSYRAGQGLAAIKRRTI